jgi:phenylacetaldehyde dehydrogenase
MLTAPGIELLDSVRAFIAQPQGLLIDGRVVDALDGRTFESVDPSTGDVVATVARGSAADVDAAVASSQAAFPGWASMAASDRQLVLHRFADAVEAHAKEIAQLDSIDTGKPVAYVEAVDVAVGVAHLRYYADYPTRLTGEHIAVSVPHVDVRTRREPLGVVGAIVPWNFPFCQAAFKLAPALAAGCTVVLKPAEETPLSALRIGELALEAGIPPGVLNVVTGYGDAGAALVKHPGVAKIAFTGSGEVGREIVRTGADTLKHVSLELGGKSPQIIFADADVETAAANAAIGIFFYSGQVCAAGSRLMVEREVYDDVLNIIVEEGRKMQLGHGLDLTTTMGPLISGDQRDRVAGYVDGARDAGANVVDAGVVPGGELADGFFYAPTVIDRADDDLTAVREEIFGPVLVAQEFGSIDELVERANTTSYGLAAGIWTRDDARAQQVAAKLQVGTVWVNTYNLFDPAAPWGGYKQSGLGRDGGQEGIDKFLQTKTIWTSKPS